MENSDAQDKEHRSSELQEAGFSSLSTTKEERILSQFLTVLQKHNPNREREAGNYKHCLGLLLTLDGLPYGELSQEVFESLALYRDDYFADLLHRDDVRKLVAAFGAERTAELFLGLHEAFHAEAAEAWGPRVNRKGRAFSPEELREARDHWLARTRLARYSSLQDLVQAAQASTYAPVEWLLDLVDFVPLRKQRKWPNRG